MFRINTREHVYIGNVQFRMEKCDFVSEASAT